MIGLLFSTPPAGPSFGVCRLSDSMNRIVKANFPENAKGSETLYIFSAPDFYIDAGVFNSDEDAIRAIPNSYINFVYKYDERTGQITEIWQKDT